MIKTPSIHIQSKNKKEAFQRNHSLQFLRFQQPSTPTTPVLKLPTLRYFRERLNQCKVKKTRYILNKQEKKEFYLKVGKQWFREGLQNQQLCSYFQKKKQASFIQKYSDYLGMIFKEQNDLNLHQLKQIHSFGVPSLLYTHAKIILFNILFNVQGTITPKELMVYSRRMEYVRLYITQINQFFLIHPIQKVCHKLEGKNPKCCHTMNSLLVFFLYQSNSLESLRSFVRQKKIKIPYTTYIEIKILLVKLCHQEGIPGGILNRLLDNLRFVKALLVEGMSMTDYVESQFGSVDKFIELIKRKVSFFQKNANNACYYGAISLLYYLFEVNEYTFSVEEIFAILKKKLKEEETKIFCCQLLEFVKPRFERAYYQYLLSDLKRYLSIYKRKNNVSKNVQNLGEFFNKFSKSYKGTNFEQGRRCSVRSIALMMDNHYLYDKEEMSHIHSRLCSQDLQLYRYCMSSCQQYKSLEFCFDRFFSKSME